MLMIFVSLQSVIPNVVGVMTNLSEEQVLDKCFDLVFAFDEVSALKIFKHLHIALNFCVPLRYVV